MYAQRSCWDNASIRVTVTSITAQFYWDWNARINFHST